jgi:hypothetical protein
MRLSKGICQCYVQYVLHREHISFSMIHQPELLMSFVSQEQFSDPIRSHTDPRRPDEMNCRECFSGVRGLAGGANDFNAVLSLSMFISLIRVRPYKKYRFFTKNLDTISAQARSKETHRTRSLKFTNQTKFCCLSGCATSYHQNKSEAKVFDLPKVN